MVAEYHVAAAHALKSAYVGQDEKKKSLILSGGDAICGKISLVTCICLIICFVSVFGAATSSTYYSLTTDSVCATDTLRCTCDLPTAWPIATRAFYDNAPYDQTNADWYASTMGWVFDPHRGICPLGAVQVWVTLSNKLKWQGTLQQYQEDYSSGDVNVPQRRLSGEEQDAKLFLPHEAAAFLQENTDGLSQFMSNVAEMAHNLMMKVGLASEKDPLVLNVGDDHPRGFHRQLKTTSSSDSKPTPKTYYNYRNCMRKQYKDQIEKVWETADSANSAASVKTDGKSFAQAYADFNLAQTLILLSVIFTSIFLIPYVVLFFYALKYEYTGFGGPKYGGKGMFPFVGALAIMIILTALAGRANSAITQNDFLSMPKAGWAPFLPGCNVAVTTGRTSSLTAACLGMGISMIVIMVILGIHYVITALKPKTALDLHEESLMSIEPKIPYLLDSAKVAQNTQK